MNQFSKEELEALIININQLRQLKIQRDEFYSELQDKILNMIDNYCDEEPNNPNFTQKQKDFICWQIGKWYLMMKPLLEVQHNLGYMKEKLKLMVCNDDNQ